MGIIGVDRAALENLYLSLEKAKSEGRFVRKASFERLGNLATVWAILDDGGTVETQLSFSFQSHPKLAPLEQVAGRSSDPAATDRFLDVVVQSLERSRFEPSGESTEPAFLSRAS